MNWRPEDAKLYAARFSDLQASGFPGMTNALHIRAFAECTIWLDEICFSVSAAPIDTTSTEIIQAGPTAPVHPAAYLTGKEGGGSALFPCIIP